MAVMLTSAEVGEASDWYIVLAPGLAPAHARAEFAVALRRGLPLRLRAVASEGLDKALAEAVRGG